MNKFLVSAAAALAVIGFSLPASAGFDAYNAKYVNSPEAKAAALVKVCAYSSDQTAMDILTCEQWKTTGVPDGDVRIGVTMAGAIAGGVLGGAIFTTPTLIGQTGALTVFGTKVTMPVAIGVGTLVGAAATAAAIK
jgi:hypothetical protein